MSQTSAPIRVGLWRVTRHERVRALYDRLADAGVLLAQLDRFERETGGAVATRIEPPADVGVRLRRAADGLPGALADAPVAPDDRLLVARRGGDLVGYCVLSDRPVYVPALRRRLRFEGAYLWRLFVESSARGCGIGTAIIGGALTAGREAFGRDRLTALIAPDNLPSRRAFARLGFRPVDRFTTVGIHGWRLDRRRPLATAPG